ncbi:MAG: helix-turn-helix domain-containing protein [Pseudomonadota bacterium]
MTPRDPSPALEVNYQAAVLIKSLRSFFRLNQHELATLSRVSRPTIDRIESLRGIDKARTGTLEQLLDVFRRLGVEVHLDPAHGASVHYTLTAMVLSVERLASVGDIQDRLAVFQPQGSAGDGKVEFDRLLEFVHRTDPGLVQVYRGRPSPDREHDPERPTQGGQADQFRAVTFFSFQKEAPRDPDPEEEPIHLELGDGEPINVDPGEEAKPPTRQRHQEDH